MGGAEGPEKPIRLFYSYSRRDEELRRQLEDHLAVLRWSGMIAEWHDRNIEVGDEWAKEIDRNLGSADIILLLVSASFIASAYCWSVEMKKALERHDKGEAKVIPVILRPCDWHTTPFGKLQAAPADAKPVMAWLDRDAALYDVECKIKRVVAELRQERRRAAEQAQQRAEEARKRQAAEEQQREALQRQREQEEAQKQAAAKASREQPRPKATAPAQFADFAVFREIDEPWCPEVVALPAGEFLMGSPEGDMAPQHRVVIGHRYAIGRYPVTFAEYDHFCEATSRKKPHDAGWGRGRRPVINVSWEDGKGYTEWLAKKTGKPYRLPSEAEWEYACRARTTTRYWFGDTITNQDAKYGGWFGKTTEVGSYEVDPVLWTPERWNFRSPRWQGSGHRMRRSSAGR
jgi:formylglycine-generating enzyme required for sulfatase activity